MDYIDNLACFLKPIAVAYSRGMFHWPINRFNFLKSLVFVGLFLLSGWCLAQDHDHGHGDQPVDPELEAFRNGKMRQMVSVGVFTGLGKDVCEELKKDGRDAEFGELLDSFSQKDKDCSACRPLMRTLSVPCLPVKKPAIKKIKKPAEEGSEEEQPSPTPTLKPIAPQRIPSAPAIRAVVEYAYEAADHDQAGELKKAFKKIEIALRSGQVKSDVAREYFDILLTYMLEPIEEIQDVTEPAKDPEEGDKANRKSVDTLFE